MARPAAGIKNPAFYERIYKKFKKKGCHDVIIYILFCGSIPGQPGI
jgi:hypothetical protein